MHKVLFLALFLSPSVYSESVRETETWMPIKTTQAVSQEPISSGDFSEGSDFAFPNEGRNSFDDDEEDEDEDDENYDDMSGSGDEEDLSSFINGKTIIREDVYDNQIPQVDRPVRPKPTGNINDLVKKNEISLNRAVKPEDVSSNVLMAHSGEESIFNKTEVQAALIAGGAVGLILAVLLILLLVYRMKKKDEGSYDLGKKPIYKKAPTTEIYA
ncbi:hypothetical protein DPEC_G00208350 [Dallia pectoralis]|uniref:Uncharacterized protein n=1 Tax=Dallia pectoralis TaxID=75939 RepID=A0ACC2G552_DALPE|nr:hypothetical protein DPEC_G00208350 [Dallia pectoralis]